MKKFFILFLALTFVLSMAAFAVADDGGAVTSMTSDSSVTIGGDARIRGVWQNDYDFNDSTAANGANDADNAWIDQRIRLNITAAIGNGIEVRSRFTSGTNTHDTTLSNAGVANTSSAVNVDYMYLHIPVNNFVIDAGNMHRNWGNKLLMWDVGRDTIQVTTNVADTQIGFFIDKINETLSNGGTVTDGSRNLEDNNNYGVFVNHTAGNLAAGLIIIREKDDRGPVDTDGTEISVYLNTSVGAIGIAGEIARKSGDIGTVNTATANEDSFNNNMTAGFINVSTDIGAISVDATFALSKNGFTADSHYTPTVFFGTDNPTAVWNVTSAANSTTKAYIIGASTDISSDLSASAKLAYFDLENLATALVPASTVTLGNEDATEIDLGLAYKLADNATYKVDFGYFMPDNITTTDDTAVALAHKIEVAF